MIEPRTDYERQIIDCVDRYGCFITTVLPEDQADGPPFCYSVGFTRTFALPEVIFLGLPADTGHALVNDLAAMCRDGLRIGDGQRVDGLISNYPAIARTVDESWIIQSYFASALWFHRTQMDAPLRDVLQMVWPDPQGFYPWDKSCAEWVKSDQPALYQPRLAA